MEADYSRYQKRSLKWRLAYSAGFETMTMGATKWLINNREKLFAGADPAVTSFVLWHMVEETEHKTVAHAVYQQLYSDYWARAWGLFCGSWHIVRYGRKSYINMLKKDGKWSDWRSRWRAQKRGANFLWNVGKTLMYSILPGHDPDNIKDPKWVADWMEAYADLPEGFIPLLNTNEPGIPARFGESAA